MSRLPKQVAEFLSCPRIAVAGVSRDPQQPANAIYRKLRNAGHQVFAVNPQTAEVEGAPCYPDLRSVPQPIQAVMVVTPPSAAAQVVKDCAALCVQHIWFHRSFGDGSVSEEAVRECERLGINCLVGGCPMMYCEPVDFGHRCMKWILKMQKRVPG